MNKRWTTAVVLTLAAAAGAGTLWFARSGPGELGAEGKVAATQPAHTVRVVLNDKPFNVEVAVTEAEHERGLMDRTQLPADGGMIFVFDPPEDALFWMKDTLIPLDLVFIDAGGHIVRTFTMPVQAPGTPDDRLPRYSSGKAIAYAVELPAGTSEKIGLRDGQAVGLPSSGLKHSP